MSQARIFTVFVFEKPTAEGIVQYTRHLIPALSDGEAQRTARKLLQQDFPGFAVIDKISSMGDSIAHLTVNTLRDASLTIAEFDTWKRWHLRSFMESGDWHEATHARLY